VDFLRAASADYCTSSRAAGPHQRHAQGNRGVPGGGGVEQDRSSLIYPPSLAKQPFQAPPPPRGYRGSGGGCLKWRYTPLLGAANFFRELDSSATSTTGGTERRPWPAISAVSLGSILGRRRGHRHRGGRYGLPGWGVSATNPTVTIFQNPTASSAGIDQPLKFFQNFRGTRLSAAI
jgi:hypothetical protein